MTNQIKFFVVVLSQCLYSNANSLNTQTLPHSRYYLRSKSVWLTSITLSANSSLTSCKGVCLSFHAGTTTFLKVSRIAFAIPLMYLRGCSIINCLKERGNSIYSAGMPSSLDCWAIVYICSVFSSPSTYSGSGHLPWSSPAGLHITLKPLSFIRVVSSIFFTVHIDVKHRPTPIELRGVALNEFMNTSVEPWLCELTSN